MYARTLYIGGLEKTKNGAFRFKTIATTKMKRQKPCAFVLKTIETIETIFYFKKNIDISQKQVQAKKILSLLSLLSLK